MARGIYTVKLDRVSSGTAICTLIELEQATGVLEIIRVKISNTDVEVSNQWAVNLVTLSTDGTNVSTPTIVAHDLASAAHGSTVRGMATAAFVVDNVIIPDGFNILNGYEFLPTIDERITLAAGKAFAVHLPVAPPAAAVISTSITYAVHG